MILGVTGKARSGKDTFAAMLAEELFDATKQRYVLMAYATELKQRVQKDFDLSFDQLWGDEKEVADPRYEKPREDPEDTITFWTAREILQAYGQFFRTIDYNFWVRALFDTIEYKGYGNVIVTDVRHPNEADPIRERGGVVIRVSSNRQGLPQIHGTTHISEIAMDDYQCDFNITNDFGLKELRGAARETAALILNLGDKSNG
jgi:hypothetical protein